MSGDKNTKYKLGEFFRYIRNELSGRERNTFEREIQRDPFTEEALEGFSIITEKEAIEDISDLNARLRKKTSRKSTYLIYRIAGVVVLFILISSIFVVTVIKKPVNQLAINTHAPEALEIIKDQPVIVSDSKENAISGTSGEEKKYDHNASKTAARTQERVERRKDSVGKTDEISNDIAIPESKAFSSKEELSKKMVVSSAPMAALARKQAVNGYTIRGKVLSSEDNMPIPGVNVIIKGSTKGTVTDLDGNFNINLPDSSSKTIVASSIGMETEEMKASPQSRLEIMLKSSGAALSEVVVTGYSSKKSDYMDTGDISEYLHPQPEGGKSKFDDYVKNNLRRPVIADGGKKMVVVLSFLVRPSGQIDSMMIIKSPGKAYSDEAIRVIKAGPSWNPAKVDGKTIEEDVRLRIVFR